MFSDIVNLYAVFVAALLSMVLGSLWYSPLLFGKAWMRLRGQTTKVKDMSFPPSKMIIEFVCSLVTAFVLGLFAFLLPGTVYAAVIFALTLWVGFYITMLLGEVLWEDKPFGLFLINASFRLLSLVVMTTVLVMWR